VEIRAGSKLCNANFSKDADGKIEYGTLGGIVYDSDTKEELLITCFHCVMAKGKVMGKDKDNPFDWKNNNSVSIIINEKPYPIGQIIDVKLTDEVDIAIIKPHEKTNSDINDMGIPNDYVSTSNLTAGSTRVWKYGATTKLTYGEYAGIDNSEEIEYPDKEMYEIRWLAKAKNIYEKKFAKGGDSGSLVMDINNRVIGVLVAINSSTTFIIRASYILADFNIKFTK
jgi:hypothetical protein